MPIGFGVLLENLVNHLISFVAAIRIARGYSVVNSGNTREVRRMSFILMIDHYIIRFDYIVVYRS